MSEHLALTFIAGAAVAATSGLVGSFLILRRMTLISDALSHVALPGIALGVLLHFQPLLGGLAFLFLGVFVIWKIEHATELAVESITGVLFVTALAAGALLIPESELLETFFGDFSKIGAFELALTTAISLAILGTTFRYRKALVLTSVAPDLAVAAHISHPKMELLLLTLIALTITVGISFVGVLLMSALLIIPAATARNLTGSYRSFATVSMVLAIVTLTSAIGLARVYGTPPGPLAALIGAALFTLSFLRR